MPMSVHEFVADEWFNTSRGRQAVIAHWPDKTLGDARALRGQEVIIDGELYKVKGVETFALGDNASARNFGLIIEAPAERKDEG